jgi:hypothetical protein
MLNFIVLGIIPGTSIELTLNWLLALFSVVGLLIFIRHDRKNRRQKKNAVTSETVSQLA